MSTYSQPVNIIIHNDNNNHKNLPYKPKYIKQNSNTQRSSLPDIQSNKLPLNLFMSSTQYNKMIITHGKNRKKPVSHLNDGFGTNLQYINDQIFQKINQERAVARQSIKSASKSSKKAIDECSCCCCQEFCQQCSNRMNNCTRLSQSQVKKVFSSIDNQIALARKGVKASINESSKKSYKNQQIYHSRRAISAVSDIRSNNNHQIQIHPGVDISHLIVKSLIEFQQTKKRQAFLKQSRKNSQKAKQQFIHMLNDKIRQNNLQASRFSRSKSSQKSLSKAQLSTKYWNQVKQDVFNNLRTDNYSATLKKQLNKFQFHPYNHQDLPKRDVTLTKQQISKLRIKHQKQAKKLIDQQIKEKQIKENKIKRSLQSLQKERIQHILQVHQKPFKPSQQMIQQAFKNIVEPKKIAIIDGNKSTEKKNQGLKKQGKNQLIKSKKQIQRY